MKAWGRFTRRAVYERHEPMCTIPRIIMYGLNTPSGYYYYGPDADPRILQTQRILGFMPTIARSVLFLHYVTDGMQAFKARRLNITQHKFREVLEFARSFYDKYRDTPLPMFIE